MVITAVGIIVNEWAVQYSSGLESDLGEYSKLNEVSDTIETQKGNINPQSGEASSDFETGMFRGGYGIITGMYASLRTVFGEDGMIDSVVERFGLPDYVWNGWVAFVVISITLSIIAIVFRLGRTSA